MKNQDDKDLSSETELNPALASVAARRVSEYKIKSGLKSLRITAAPDIDNTNPDKVADNPVDESETIAETKAESEYVEEQPVVMLSPLNAQSLNPGFFNQSLQIVGAFLSVLWLAICVFYLFDQAMAGKFTSMAPQDLGAMVTGFLAPVALLWMIISTIQRHADVQRYADVLRGELQSLIFPTEERSRIIHKDIEALCRQAAELAVSSKAVVKAIHRARTGLRTEVRDFVGISKKTEFHIDRLTDTLHERAAKLLVLTDDIEQRTSMIADKTKDGVDAWGRVTDTILDHSTKMETALVAGTGRLLDAANTAGEKTREIETNLDGTYVKLGKTVDDVAGRLDALNARLDDHTGGLAKVVEKVSGETERLGVTIQNQARQLDGVAARTLEAMEKSAETIQNHRDALDKGAENVAQQAERMAGTITASLDKLGAAATDVTGKTESLEIRVTAQANLLRDAVKSVDTEAEAIEQAGQSAANKLTEAMSTALTGSESISAAVRRAVESLEKSTAAAREQSEAMIATTLEHVEKLNQAGEGNAEHIRAIIDMLQTSRTQIEESAKLTDEQVKKLSEAVENQAEKITLSTATVVEKIGAVRASLDDPLKDMVQAVTAAGQKHAEIETTLSRRVGELNEASEKAKDTAETIRAALRSQVQDISELSGQISGHARIINEQMTLQKDTLDEQVKKSLADVEAANKVLESQAQKLHSLSESAIIDVTLLEGQIESRYGEVSRVVEKVATDLANLEDAIGQRATTLKTQAESATTAVTAVRDALDQTADGFEPLFSRAIDQAQKTQAQYETLRVTFDDTTAGNLERLKQIGVIFDERLESLKSGSEDAARILRASSEEMQDRVTDIEAAARSASDKIDNIQSSLESQSSDIHLITDQALLKIEAIQKAVNEQFQELSEGVGQVLSRVGNVVDELSRSGTVIDTVSEQTVSEFTRIGDSARAETDRLKEASGHSVKLASAVVAQIQSESDNMLRAARDTLLELKKTGDTFAIRTREVSEQMKAALQTAQAYGSELRNQAGVVAESSTSSADRISQAVVGLRAHMDEIDATADKTIGKVEQSRDRLATESERLVTVSSAAVRAADEVSGAFGRQASALLKATHEAAQQIDVIRKAEGRAQREAFLSAAKFIVESLHSLSVDLTRMMDGEVPEKTWKAFQKGDVGAFTRRLAQLGRDLPMDKLRGKFADDSEFRTYVQRFIRQFEDLFDQAVANDHGDLLAATFTSSDMGRLYEILCAAAGREAKFNREDKKAV